MRQTPAPGILLALTVESRLGGSKPLEVLAPRLALAMFSGRDRVEVEHHIRELEKLGVAPPRQVPAFLVLPTWLLQVAPAQVEVLGAKTSGEAEPVLVKLASGELYVGVGSDHTDRDLEGRSISLSKQVCPKVLGRCVWPYEEIAEHWDAVRLSSTVGADVPYQEALLASIRPPLDLLEAATAFVRWEGPLVLFLGTVPLKIDAFRFDAAFAAELEDPADGRSLSCRYSVEALGGGIDASGEA